MISMLLFSTWFFGGAISFLAYEWQGRRLDEVEISSIILASFFGYFTVIVFACVFMYNAVDSLSDMEWLSYKPFKRKSNG